ncbi:MAG: prephenate dehydrogenase/arogenate dehydrogenase family protein [Acidobacteriaceae bacterium]|nr:prephenate dehydrogenase/arogenate dehydrogenase family protein [Acidobacteriaceae bacterium]
MKTVAIVGVGLIGGSFGLALRKAGFEGEIAGVSSERSVEAGIKAGAISRAATLEEAAESADLLYLAQPIEQILKTIERLGRICRPGCIITDAGSTKALIVSKAREHIQSAVFIGGHPMAGKEQRGVEAAEADLFRGRPYVLTPTEGYTQAVNELRGWLDRIGAQVLSMAPGEHDLTVAFTSHLPQLLSTALAASLSRQDTGHFSRVFGPGLIDMTRLALSDPEVWASVLATNKAAILEAVAAFEHELIALRRDLEADHGIVDHFTSAATFSSKIRKPPCTT